MMMLNDELGSNQKSDGGRGHFLRRHDPGSSRMAISGSVFSAVLALVLIAAPVANSGILTCPNIDKIEQVFLNQHVVYSTPDAALESRVVDQYVKRLDGAKIYFFESDIAEIKRITKGLFGKLKNGDCVPLDRIQNLLLKRVKERATYAHKTLESKKWKFDSKTEITIDPDTRKFPQTKADADKYQSKYLQFQISNYMATGLSQKEAQKQVVRNYDRLVKRIEETSKEDLYSNYLDAFGRGLDPHSSFFSRDMLEDFEISMGLSLEGIGATLSSQDGFTVIEQLIEGGSAKASGQLQVKDQIVAVGQVEPGKSDAVQMENVFEMDLRDVVRKIRGPKGTKVRLQVLRKGNEGTEKLFVDLVRDKIKLEEEAAALTMLDREVDGKKIKVAVLNLPSFYADGRRGGRSSARDLKALVAEAREKGATTLVLDLSQNGGGSLDDAVKIAGLFFKTGNVVKQSTRDPEQVEMELQDRDSTVDWEGPMVVLTSRISASASEIVSGTLKDYRRAVIVGGDHTFGKGSVQSVVPMAPGLGAVKVTIGMFFTPGGYSTQHRGVAADIVLPGVFSTDEIGEKSLDYSLPPKKIPEFLSKDAYSPSWKKIDDDVIKILNQRSQGRVASSEDFKKILDEMKKNKEKNKVIKLSDALKETKEKKDEADQKKSLSKAEKEAEYLKRADLQEAINVATDLYSLQVGVPLPMVSPSSGKSSDSKAASAQVSPSHTNE